MRYHWILNRRKLLVLLCWLVFPLAVFPAVTWTGAGLDGAWSNPLNWVDGLQPDSADEVLLDNSGLSGSYQVILPDQPVSVRSVTITPANGNSIELILPASNIQINALRVLGPGYGIVLNAGAVFRNASGLAGGESLSIADSIRINNDGKYIHQTRASHASGILQWLSSAPGTEKGIFEFDVPKASYTISVSNRTYGSLLLSAAAYGLPVNYTCSGSSPLQVAGDLRIGNNVSWSVNMSGNGNIQVEGDYFQAGGTVNVASGETGHSFLRIRGDLIQSPGAILTASGTDHPGIEMNGERLQRIDAEGLLTNHLDFRVNNAAGCELLFPLLLPSRLQLLRGRIISTENHLLSLAAACDVQTDSGQGNSSYVDGPLCKKGLSNEAHFIFPVGRDGQLRWLELKQATGDFTVEYRNENPGSLGALLGPGIDHISKMEYWTVKSEGPGPPEANIELSFVSPQSGGITDPDFLHVSGFTGSQWSDAGHTGITGGPGYGSVVSETIRDFSGQAFTLASSVNLENPMPLVQIQFEGRENQGRAFFRWSLESPVTADHFDLLESTDNQFHLLARITANPNQTGYSWSDSKLLRHGRQWYKLNMIDRTGNFYSGRTISIAYAEPRPIQLFWVPAFLSSGKSEIHILASVAARLDYRILSVSGRELKRGDLSIAEAEREKIIPLDGLPPGVYQFNACDHRGKTYGLRFVL